MSMLYIKEPAENVSALELTVWSYQYTLK